MEIKYSIQSRKLLKPFTTNHRTIVDNHQLVLKIDNENFVGIGTGLLPYIEESRIAQISSFESCLPKYQEILKTAKMSNYRQIIQAIKDVDPESVFVHEAFDLALHDLLGKLNAKSLRQLLGGSSQSLYQSGYSLSAPQTLESFIAQFGEVDLNLPILKVKFTAATDLRVIEYLRSRYQGRIWVDANGAWDFSTLKSNISFLEKFDVELLEQPLAKGEFRGLAGLKGQTKLRLIADEDCVNEKSIQEISDFYDGVAIKLHKCGGLCEALATIEAAKSHGLKVMLGCRTENTIGISAISQLVDFADYVDLDGSVDVVDPYFEGTRFDKGYIRTTENLGIGVVENELN